MSRPWVLVYPHQLFEEHPALEAPGDRQIALVEDPLFTSLYPFSSLVRDYRSTAVDRWIEATERAGFRVVRVSDIESSSDIFTRLGMAAGTEVRVADPCDDWLEQALRRGAAAAKIELEIIDSPAFLLARNGLTERVGDSPRMASFYRRQRTELNVLITSDGQPVGGRWSFDTDNRKRIPRDHSAPEGSMDDLPTTPSASREWFDAFLLERLDRFGDYEDAIDERDDRWYHAAISPMINCGLLTPRWVLDRTLEFARDRERDGNPVPINSLEGFIRQLIGWREFMRATYVTHGRRMRTANALGHTRAMPRSFYEGTTGLPPFDRAVQKTLRLGWAHHIERLMVIGNLMALCRIHPDAVYQWFMELYVDAWDWVMVPNVYAMSQYADGGLITTKPYVSGSNYLRKMGRMPGGDWQSIWDGLYWTFVKDNRELFERSPRLAMMTRQLDRMNSDRRSQIFGDAQSFLERLE